MYETQTYNIQDISKIGEKQWEAINVSLQAFEWELFMVTFVRSILGLGFIPRSTIFPGFLADIIHKEDMYVTLKPEGKREEKRANPYK